MDRKTIRRYARRQIPPGWPPALRESVGANSPTPATGSGEPDALGVRAAPRVDRGAGAARAQRPEHLPGSGRAIWLHAPLQLGQALRADAAERASPSASTCSSSSPGEEAQVDYGQGALTRAANGKYRRPYLFVMTLKYSGKSFRKVVWKTNQEIWARLHEEAFRAFGGVTQYVVLDNLREGVIKPDLYEPELNPVYAALLAHYGVVADVCRVGDPNRKGTVESAIQHTQSTALKGRRFESHRGTERVAGALGGALGGPAHPRPQEAPGAGDVPGGEAASAPAADRRLALLPPRAPHRR